jgi:hypothetical protein
MIGPIASEACGSQRTGGTTRDQGSGRHELESGGSGLLGLRPIGDRRARSSQSVPVSAGRISERRAENSERLDEDGFRSDLP